MIAYLRGHFYDMTPTTLTVECGGVGYLVNISLTTYGALQGHQEGKVLVSQVIREDSHQLYGFATRSELELFELLTSVSGIGPNTARVILSRYTPAELNSILALGQVDALKAVKGIGLKTAQRVILELKGKVELGDEAGSASTAVSGAVDSQVLEEASGALRMLGFQDVAVNKVVRQLLGATPGLSVEQVIKQALKLL